MAAIDIDGTLLGPDKQISAANASAVSWLIQSGIQVILASARSHASALRIHQALQLDTPMVSSQGALVQDVLTGTILFRQDIPEAHVDTILQQAKSENGTLLYFRTDAIYIAKRTPFSEGFESRGRHRLIECGDLSLFNGEGAQKLLWIDHPEQTKHRLERFKTEYKKHLGIEISHPEYLEITAVGVNKALGLQHVAEYYGIDASEVVAFGDGNNDIPMFRWAGESVAMAHASPDAKASATTVSPAGDPSSSLARAVKNVFFSSDSHQRKRSGADLHAGQITTKPSATVNVTSPSL